MIADSDTIALLREDTMAGEKWHRTKAIETLRAGLCSDPCRVPEWIMALGPEDAGRPFPLAAFLGERVILYPGAGTDDRAIALFGGAHSACCFVYADYAAWMRERVRESFKETTIDDDAYLAGYRLLFSADLDFETVFPFGREEYCGHAGAFAGPERWACWLVFERLPNKDDRHGPARLVLLYLGCEAVSVFDGLFRRHPAALPPFGILLQDHGWGGNWTRFGGPAGQSALFAVACPDHLPQWLAVAGNTRPWPGYAAFDPSPDRDNVAWPNHALYRLSMALDSAPPADVYRDGQATRPEPPRR
jgi:hypothetical protein